MSSSESESSEVEDDASLAQRQNRSERMVEPPATDCNPGGEVIRAAAHTTEAIGVGPSKGEGADSEHIPIDMDAFKRYWKDKMSDRNLDTCVRVVRKLANGDGVKHKAKDDEVFYQGTKIGLQTDLEKVLSDAKEWLPRQLDKSKGWALSHPIRKLAEFQQGQGNRSDSSSDAHTAGGRSDSESTVVVGTGGGERAEVSTESDHELDTQLETEMERQQGTTSSGEDEVVRKAALDGLSAKRKAETLELKRERKRGAVFAPSRAEEGFALASGRQESCLVDAVWNGMKTLDSSAVDVTLAKLRRATISDLSNVRQASWGSVQDALVRLRIPFELTDVSSVFQSGGAPMLNLLNAPAGKIYIVALRVTVGGRHYTSCCDYDHCVMLSTIPEPPRAPLGKMVDNGSKNLPVYIEPKDKEHKVPAKRAFQTLLSQKIEGKFTVFPTDIYELSRTPT